MVDGGVGLRLLLLGELSQLHRPRESSSTRGMAAQPRDSIGFRPSRHVLITVTPPTEQGIAPGAASEFNAFITEVCEWVVGGVNRSEAIPLACVS